MLGDQLSDARIRAGLSMYALAKRSGIGVASISEIESGTTLNPGILTMVRLADALHVSLDQLSERTWTLARAGESSRDAQTPPCSRGASVLP